MAFEVLYTLLQRHEAAEEYYRKAVGLVTEDDLKTMLDSLADYHGRFGRQVREFLEDAPPIPIPNKSRKNITPPIKERWEEVQEVIEKDDRVSLINICHQNEEDMAYYYQIALSQNKGLAEGIRNFLNEQHQKVIQITRKLDRLEVVPQQRDMDLDI